MKKNKERLTIIGVVRGADGKKTPVYNEGLVGSSEDLT